MDKKVGYLNYDKIKPIIDISFWLKFTELKLDLWKLECPALDIAGSVSLPVGANSSSNLVIDESSFTKDVAGQEESKEEPLKQTIGGLIKFRVPGKFIHFNTVEEYRAFNMEQASEDPKYAIPKEFENYFIFACFGDLKNYDFYFQVGVLQHPERIQTVKGKKLIKQYPAASSDVVAKLKEAIFAQVKEHASSQYLPQHFLLADNSFVKVDSLSSKISSLPAEGEPSSFSAFLIFFDNGPLHPSIFLHNVIHSYLKQVRDSQNEEDFKVVLKIILVKDKVSQISNEIKTLDGSFYCEVILSKKPVEELGPKLVSLQDQKISLKDQLDTLKIVENAADLNLKLMKWRQAPQLQLDVLQQTSCLLLGSGSLGCQVARNLVSWGYRKITFVDAGKVSYSNPVRQCLFTYEDSIQPNNFKAPIAAKRLQEVFPMVETRGEILKIPMPGHAVGSNEAAITEVLENTKRLEDLVKEHDAIFLLTDSRESRWLPTVLANVHNKVCFTIALGFETWLAMRHGQSASVHEATNPNIKRLGCYFCNDVVAPRNSLQDRSLDQQCTVSRPALCCMASSVGVELLCSVLNHPLKHGARAMEDPNQCDKSALGIIPQQIRGDLSTFTQNVMYGESFDKCIACARVIQEKYEENREEFVIKACNEPDYLEDVTGITAMNEAINMDDIEAIDDFEWD